MGPGPASIAIVWPILSVIALQAGIPAPPPSATEWLVRAARAHRPAIQGATAPAPPRAYEAIVDVVVRGPDRLNEFRARHVWARPHRIFTRLEDPFLRTASESGFDGQVAWVRENEQTERLVGRSYTQDRREITERARLSRMLALAYETDWTTFLDNSRLLTGAPDGTVLIGATSTQVGSLSGRVGEQIEIQLMLDRESALLRQLAVRPVPEPDTNQAKPWEIYSFAGWRPVTKERPRICSRVTLTFEGRSQPALDLRILDFRLDPELPEGLFSP